MKRYTLIFFVTFCIIGKSQINITINDSVTYQTIAGFGAFGGDNQNNDAFLTNVVNDLGLTINRQNYNFDETDANWTSTRKPYLQALKAKAESLNEPVLWFFSVWTPNTYWKANNQVCDTVCSSKCNAQMDKSPSCNGTNNYLIASNYDEFAATSASFFKKVSSETGITPYGYSIQNEPAFNEPYVSCKYTPDQYNSLLKVTKEEFVKQGLSTKFIGAEDMGRAGALATWTNIIFNDPVSVNYLDVCAVHGYTDGINASTGDAPGWTAMNNTASSKKKQLWMTETSGYCENWLGQGSGTSYINGSFDLSKAIYYALKFGKVNAWVWWSLNDNKSKPSAEHYAILYNAVPTKNYYVSKSYYRYIRPGAVQVESESGDISVYVATFKNGGNSSFSAVKPQFTIVLINNATSAKTVNLTGRSIPTTMKAYRTSSSENCVTLADATTSSVSLPAQSITTLVYQSVNKSPTITQPNDIVIVQNTTNKTVSLANVTAGSGETGTLTVSAISSDKTLIPGAITVTGASPNYTLSFSPAAGKTGNATIKVFVKDNGTDILNTTVVTFNVKVIAAINIAPTIDPVINYTVGLNNKSKKNYIWFNGITDGNGGTQSISKPALTLSNASVLRLPYVNYTANNTFGTMEFYPDQLGTTSVTVKVQDDGGTDLGGVDSKTITFTITVVADAPLLGEKENREQTLAVFPNPASDLINVILPDDSYSSIQVIDMTGKELMHQNVTAVELQLDASMLNNGVYFIVAKGEKGTSKAKIVISK